MLEYSYSGHESITIEFHKTFKKKVILYLILNKSTENTANCKWYLKSHSTLYKHHGAKAKKDDYLAHWK